MEGEYAVDFPQVVEVNREMVEGGAEGAFFAAGKGFFSSNQEKF